MTPAQLETVYEALATTLDKITEGKRELFLAKLALLMAQEMDDAEKVRGLIDAAAQDLDA